MVPKLCPHLPPGHLCPLPSCRIDLVFPKTYESGPAFGLCPLWLECSSPDSHMLCLLTSFRPLTRTACLLTNASKNLTDYCHLRKLIQLNISWHHPWVFQIISLLVPIWNYSLHFSTHLCSPYHYVHKWCIPWYPKEKLIAAFLYSHDWLTCFYKDLHVL